MLESVVQPSQLTCEFVRLLHQSQGNHTGYFQIVEFHEKRQKYYSTHISDGYFKCKVIFKDKASKQIEKGQIKLFSILHGAISNQGNRILMVFNQLKFWDYSRTVGFIRSWRFQSTNNYLNGSNLINWFSDQDASKINHSNTKANKDSDNDNETVSVASYSASEINPRKNSRQSESAIKLKHQLSTNSLQNHAFSFGVSNEQSSQTLYHGSTQSISFLPARNNIQSKAKSDQVYHTQKESDEKIKKLLIVSESQSENNLSHAKSTERHKQSNQKQKETIKDRFSRVSEVPSFREDSKQKTNPSQEKIHHSKLNQTIKDNKKSEDDDDMFEQMKAQMSKIRQRKLEEFLDEPEESLKHQFAVSKSRVVSNSKSVANQQSLCKSVTKSRRKSVYDFSMSSDEEGSRSYSNIKPKMSNTKASNVLPTPNKRQRKLNQTDFEQLVYESQQKANQHYKADNELGFSELSIRNDGANQSKNWISVLIIGIKSMQQLSNTKLIIIAEEFKKGFKSGYIFNIVLSGADVYCPFEEGEAYQMSLSDFNVTQPLTEQMFVSVQLRNNSQNVKARKTEILRYRSREDEAHFCYIPLSKIEDLKEGVSLNLVGLVYSYKNISNRKKNGGWTNIFTIIDPFTGNSVNFTIFDACKLIYEPGSPVVVFNAVTKMYQGKMTLGVRNYTFYYFGKEIVYDKFSRLIPQVDKIRHWQEEGHTVADIIELSDRYRQISSLFQVKLLSEQAILESLGVETPICRITKMSPFYFRLLCDSCNKKLSNGTQNCFNCGRRQNPLKQLQLSLQVSDNSHSLYVEFNHYDSINFIGEDGQRLVQFLDFIMHRRVKLWLRLNPKYKPSVVKMLILEESKLVAKGIQQLRQLLRFL